MTFFSHILATFLLGKILKLKTRKQWFLAFLFGVGIDFLDLPHIIVATKGFFQGETGFGHGGQHYYRSFIQEPISLLWVIPLSFWFKSAIPVKFFILQFLMDFVCQFEKRPFWPISDFSTSWGLFPSATLWEFLISLGLVMGLVYFKRGKIVKEITRARAFVLKEKRSPL